MNLHITENHTGKMLGMKSLSTSCLDNKICNARSKSENTACKICYARKLLKRYISLRNVLEQNGEVLTSKILSYEELPVINAFYFRFEAFGDLMNKIQVINYFNICTKNPYVRFALWTKNPCLINLAIKDGYKKPENLNIVYSSFHTNRIDKDIIKKYPFIDTVFTVFTKDFEKSVEINCGKRRCIECRKCYEKHDGLLFINELMK